jgi:hypothetical protein
LTRPEGLLFVYLYGAAALKRWQRGTLALARTGLAGLGFGAKRALLARLLPGRDAHQAFDLLSPLVNDRHTEAEVGSWLAELGFTDVATTIEHADLFLRAAGTSARRDPSSDRRPRLSGSSATAADEDRRRRIRPLRPRHRADGGSGRPRT